MFTSLRVVPFHVSKMKNGLQFAHFSVKFYALILCFSNLTNFQLLKTIASFYAQAPIRAPGQKVCTISPSPLRQPHLVNDTPLLLITNPRRVKPIGQLIL